MLGNRKVQHSVMLSAAKHLGPASEMLRCAQHDSGSDRMVREGDGEILRFPQDDTIVTG